MSERKRALQDLYIIAIDSPDVNFLQIQYSPFTINYSRQAKVQSLAIVGRNSDVHQYTGGATKLSLSLDFYATDNLRLSAKESIKWLESMQYSNEDAPPSRLKLNFGNLFQDEIWILQTMNATYSVFEAAFGWMPRYATANISLIRDESTNLFANNIRKEI